MSLIQQLSSKAPLHLLPFLCLVYYTLPASQLFIPTGVALIKLITLSAVMIAKQLGLK